MYLSTYLVFIASFGILPCDAFNASVLCRNSKIFTLDASKRSGAMSRRKKKSSGGSSGFGKQEENKSDTKGNLSQIESTGSGSIYSRPALYDLAFGYRNYEEEVKFLLDAHQKYSAGKDSKGDSMNVLELAAGPARHAITSLRNFGSLVSSCTAVDLSDDMIEYSNEIADAELGDSGFGGMRDNFHYMKGDMRSVGEEGTESASYLKPGSTDSAWILLGSMQHLTSNDDVISCFSSVSNLLREGGTLTIELPHPRETFTMVECTRNSWEVPLEDEEGEEYGELKIIWGDDDDRFDPIRQVRDFTVAMDLNVNDEMKGEANASDLQSVKEVVPMRLFTYQEIEAMGKIAGFEVVGMYGALSEEVDVTSEDEAFRLVCILRKVRSAMKV